MVWMVLAISWYHPSPSQQRINGHLITSILLSSTHKQYLPRFLLQNFKLNISKSLMKVARSDLILNTDLFLVIVYNLGTNMCSEITHLILGQRTSTPFIEYIINSAVDPPYPRMLVTKLNYFLILCQLFQICHRDILLQVKTKLSLSNT